MKYFFFFVVHSLVIAAEAYCYWLFKPFQDKKELAKRFCFAFLDPKMSAHKSYKNVNRPFYAPSELLVKDIGDY